VVVVDRPEYYLGQGFLQYLLVVVPYSVELHQALEDHF
jgi:hypothetical protein